MFMDLIIHFPSISTRPFYAPAGNPYHLWDPNRIHNNNEVSRGGSGFPAAIYIVWMRLYRGRKAASTIIS